MKSKPLLFAIFLFLVVLGMGFLSYSFFLPRYIEKKILPDIGRQFSGSLTGRVYSLGLSAADFGDITLGEKLEPALSIGSLHAEYSLASILARKLDSLTINAPTLNIEVSGGRIIIPGIDLQKFASSPTEKATPQQKTGITPPITLGNFQVINGLLKIRHEGELLLLPFNLQLSLQPTGGNLAVYDFSLQVLPQGEEIMLAGTLDLAGNKCLATISADSFDMNRFAYLTGGLGDTLKFGDTSIRGDIEISLLPFQILRAGLGINTESLYFTKAPIRFGPLTTGAGSALSLDLKIDGKKWLIRTKAFMQEPLSAAFDMSGSATQSEENLQGNGNISLRITDPAAAETSSPLKISLPNNPELHGNFTVRIDQSGTWQAELKSPAEEQQKGQDRVLSLLHNKKNLQADIPLVVVQGQGAADADEVNVSLILPGVQALFDDIEIRIPEADLQASYRLEKYADRSSSASGVLDITLDSTRVQKNGFSAKADLSLHGEIAPQVVHGINSLQAEGNIKIANAEIAEAGSDIKASSMSGLIPWHWPQSGKQTKGKINIPKIQWKDIDLGSFAADISLQEMMYHLEGNYKSNLLKGFVTKVSGRAGVVDSSFLGEINLKNDITPFAPLDLGILDQSLKKSSFSGELGLDGFLKLEPGGINGRMQVKVQNGRYEFPDKKYIVSGIDMEMLIPSLPDLRTAPAQKILIEQAAIGNLVFNKGKLLWQLESPDSIFLEEGVISWAGGRIFTNSVRLSPGMQEFVVPIFCDRLKLTELLRQFGVSNAEGEGTVNGRIPLLVGKDTIRFEDGFLYSSPGQGGSVKISAFDMLSAGIPQNTPQFAQVDFAAEALKNFQYNWVKLLLNSEGENLVMQMQMDGKPLQSLPFSYDSQTGLLKRADDTKQGINQAIRLDVNFRLPLNRFLGYSGKIQDIMKKIK